MWAVFALLSAVFAALTGILAKLGMEGINSNLATAIRTVVVLVMAWAIVFLTGKQHEIGDISTRSWVFLLLSGLATGLSWLCYFRPGQPGHPHRQVQRGHLHGAGLCGAEGGGDRPDRHRRPAHHGRDAGVDPVNGADRERRTCRWPLP